MTTTATATTAEAAGIAVVRAGFEAVGRGDLAAFGDVFHTDATWNHRNDDRFAGVHHGSDRIVAFIAESAQLTAGTLSPVPLQILADGKGGVAVYVRLMASRPDGRSIDDRQLLLFAVEGDRIRSVDQFVGDPAAVAAFWA